MTRWILLYVCVLLLVVAVVFELSLMFVEDGLAPMYDLWPVG